MLIIIIWNSSQMNIWLPFRTLRVVLCNLPLYHRQMRGNWVWAFASSSLMWECGSTSRSQRYISLLYPFKWLLIYTHKRSPWIALAQYRVVNVMLTLLNGFVSDVALLVAWRSSDRQLWPHFQHYVAANAEKQSQRRSPSNEEFAITTSPPTNPFVSREIIFVCLAEISPWHNVCENCIVC